MTRDVRAAYERRAAVYTERLGSMAAVHPADEHLVSTWASAVDGPVLDAGCGPGHWTAHLAAQGVDVHGVDQVPAFIDAARRRHPHVPFTVADVDALPIASASVGGVLAWYSLIHHEPAAVPDTLREFARILRPGGSLLVGFFTGPDLVTFDHAVVTAHCWPPSALEAVLVIAGFDVVETHTRTVAGGRPRPHGAVVARLRPEPRA
jgi:ubiquinone/menaquinone biosynthesis C-methylase UbiE